MGGKIMLKIFVPKCIILIAGFCLLTTEGCNREPLRDNAMKARDILIRVAELRAIKSSKIVEEEDGTKAVVAVTDNEKANRYLLDRLEELKTYYVKIKAYTEKSYPDYVDALFISSYINDAVFLSLGELFDDRADYIRQIKECKGKNLSRWVLDDFFYLIPDKAGHQNWKKLYINEKYEIIYNGLIRPLTK